MPGSQFWPAEATKRLQEELLYAALDTSFSTLAAGDIASGLWIRTFTKKKESSEDFQTLQDFKNNLGTNITFATGLHSEWAGTCQQ